VTATDIRALLPLMVLAATALVVLGLAAFRRHHGLAATVAGLGQIAALVTLPIAFAGIMTRQVTPLLVLDPYGVVFMALLLLASLVVTMLAYGYLDGRQGHLEEFYVLQLLATLGALVLVVSNHFVSFFLGLELLSVSLYTLIAYFQTDARPLEAGVKYLLLAAASSAFLLFGMALIYAASGTMAFDRIARVLAAADNAQSLLVLTGLMLTIVGVGFKLAIVPFHMWTPDVYEGAPAVVTAFVATVSKGAVAALLLRYVAQSGAYTFEALMLGLGVLAAASMSIGNLLALLQQNVKRLLAYSSIAHLGYLLVAFVVGGPRAAEAVTYYIVAYVITSLAAFGSVTVVSGKTADADTMEAYRGLFWRHPGVAIVFTASLFSLAGIPLTAGFIGKFYVLAASIEAAWWWLVALVVLNSALGLFYYLRLVVAMYTSSPEGAEARPAPRAPSWSWAGGVALTGLVVCLICLGVYPAPLIAVIRTTVAGLLAL
jgi:NADH-quinone oxidoreductase subunit N